MYKKLYKFLEINEILHPLQFGFRSKHSTLHTLISMTETIRKTIDNSNFGCGIFIDLKKAFDTCTVTLYFTETIRPLWCQGCSFTVV